MTTSLAFCANTGVSLLDPLPQTEPFDDPQASLRVAVRWHFGPNTGSRDWLNRTKALEFTPLTVGKTFEDPLDDPVSEPTVTSVCSGPQLTKDMP